MNELINLYDTITAISTPQGEGAINVIRVSGTDAIKTVDNFFAGKEKLLNSKTHTIHYGKIVDQNGITIDDVLVSVFKEPNSYTGENSVEISTHGSFLISKKIIELLLENNCRIAEPGEFTKRAFLNGRIDLAQAEAVVDVINSRTEASLRGARNQLDGKLSQKVDTLRELLVNTSSLVELELDFAEEDIEFLTLDQIEENVDKVITEIDDLIESYSFGRVIRDGVNVALVGKPNVGKSSLLNYILKESRAIVSEIPGTTRDVIREDVSIDGILFKFFDTAGIRPSEDEIEIEGVKRSREVVKNADLVLFISDVMDGIDNALYDTLLSLSEKSKIIKVFNKIDLKSEFLFDQGVLISALTGKGINSLFELLKEKAISSHSYTEKTAVVSNVRHFQALKRSKKYLLHAKQSIERKFTGEFLAVDIRNAESSLGEIIGKVTTDDILNNIFSKFCIGK